MRIIFFAGKGGVGKTSVAAATGIKAAQAGSRTLVMSLDVAHSLADIFDLDRGLIDKNRGKPIKVGNTLWIQELDIQEEIEKNWGDIHKYLSTLLNTTGLDEILAEELAILPGMGGAGQFAEVALRVAPLERGSGIEYHWAVVGGTIPTQFQSSCEKGVRAASSNGPLGFPLVDVLVEVYDGKDHPVDSKDIAFQAAAAEAFKQACANAKPQLLEPLALLKVRVPDRFTGDVISDFNGRRGRVLGMDTEGSVSVISAHVPMSEIRNYSADLRS
ncbi:MAG: ArsA-related P-loop ATPase, partial [Candidatus Desulfacyla sp.]